MFGYLVFTGTMDALTSGYRGIMWCLRIAARIGSRVTGRTAMADTFGWKATGADSFF